MNWNDLQHLRALALYGNLEIAAESMGVNRTTVSRRIFQLEQDLDAKLVDRVGRELILTEAGRETASSADLIDAELHQLESKVIGRDQALSGIVRLAMTSGIGQLLAPHIAAFQDSYPEISLELSIGGAAEDLEMMEADVALRFTTRPPEELIGKLIGRPTTAIYAATSQVKKLKKQSDLEFVTSPVTGVITEADLGVTLRPVIHTTSVEVARELVAAGKGVSQFPCYMVEGDNRLSRISDSRRDRLPQLWLLYHPRHRSRLRVRRFVDHLLDCFETLRPSIEAA